MPFSYIPTWGADVAKKPRILEAKFGDGYEQTAPDGINNNLEIWNLRFENKSNAEAQAIMTELDGYAGSTIFDWTNPNGVAIKVRCKMYNRTFTSYNVNNVSATFEQQPTI